MNKVMLLGSVGRDPEIRATASGSVVASLSIATSERFKDKQGNWQDSTEWHSLVAFARTAEVIRDYVKKGTPIHVEGRLQTRSWDQDGQKRYRTEIVIDNIILLGGKEAGGAKTERTSSKPSTPSWEDVGSQPITDDEIPF
jgi:single-strand DNA-binding protein